MTDSLMANWPSMEMAVSAGLHLFTDRWYRLCDEKWNVTPHRIEFSDGHGYSAEALYYLDRKGKIWKPPFSPGPYLPVSFKPTSTQSRPRLDRQWLTVGHLLAEDMRERGLSGSIALPPDITDVRPWQWEGFRIEVLYTYCIDLPYDESQMRSQIRRSMAKSARDGFTCTRTTKLDEVYECLVETEDRQGFSQGLDLNDLQLAQRALGQDTFRAYLCHSDSGEAVSATIELHSPGGRAVGWLAGTKSAYLRTGVSQLLHAYIMEDLTAAGATGYDFGGANLPNVAAAKAQWGGRLVPFYRIEGGRVTDLARHARNYWRFRRAAL